MPVNASCQLKLYQPAPIEALLPARTANFKTPNGQVVIVYKTPGAVSIRLPSSSTRNLSIYQRGRKGKEKRVNVEVI